jgi:hypothetical protein
MKFKVENLIFITSLFSIHLIPFANLFIFETMPILLLIFCLYCLVSSDKKIIYDILKKNKHITLLIIFLILIYFSDFSFFNGKEIEIIKYLIGPLIFFSFIRIKKYFGIDELILFGIFILLLYLILKFQIPFLFENSCKFLEFFLARLDCDNFMNTRNIQAPFLITPEPSYLSLMLCFFLILLFKYKKNASKNKKLIIFFIEIAICMIIFDTSSRIGYFFLIFYILINILKNRIIRILFLLTIFLSLLLSNEYIINKLFNIETNSKNINYLYDEINNDQQVISSRKFLNLDRITIHYLNEEKAASEDYYFFKLISDFEPTGFIRVLHNYLGLAGFLSNPFGNGIGSYPNIWVQYIEDKKIIEILKKNEVTKEWFKEGFENKKQYIQNYFFSVLHDGGFIPAIILLIIFFNILKKTFYKKDPFLYLMLIYIFISFFFQSPITSPYPWIVLALIYHDNKTQIST